MKKSIKRDYLRQAQKRNSLKGGGSKKDKKINILSDKRFSTDSLVGHSNYGIVHVTEAVGVNALRDIGTGFANFFGKSGFESELYDTVKEKAFRKLRKLVSNKKYGVGNIKIDMESTNTTIFCHLIGTIYKLT